jgi:hypothetical protein
MVSFTRSRRASMPSVPSIASVASSSQRARMASPSIAATTANRASTVPLAVYRCSAQPASVSRVEPVRGLWAALCVGREISRDGFNRGP